MTGRKSTNDHQLHHQMRLDSVPCWSGGPRTASWAATATRTWRPGQPGRPRGWSYQAWVLLWTTAKMPPLVSGVCALGHHWPVASITQSPTPRTTCQSSRLLTVRSPTVRMLLGTGAHDRSGGVGQAHNVSRASATSAHPLFNTPLRTQTISCAHQVRVHVRPPSRPDSTHQFPPGACRWPSHRLGSSRPRGPAPWNSSETGCLAASVAST